MEAWDGSRGHRATHVRNALGKAVTGTPNSDGFSWISSGNREGTWSREGRGVQDHFPMHPLSPTQSKTSTPLH